MRRRDFITIFGAAGILIGQLQVFAQTFRKYNCYDGSQFILAFFGAASRNRDADGAPIAHHQGPDCRRLQLTDLFNVIFFRGVFPRAKTEHSI